MNLEQMHQALTSPPLKAIKQPKRFTVIFGIDSEAAPEQRVATTAKRLRDLAEHVERAGLAVGNEFILTEGGVRVGVADVFAS